MTTNNYRKNHGLPLKRGGLNKKIRKVQISNDNGLVNWQETKKRNPNFWVSVVRGVAVPKKRGSVPFVVVSKHGNIVFTETIVIA